MLFPELKHEKIVQVYDKTRLDASKSFVTVDEVALTLYEIEPDTGAGFIDATSTKYLDYVYSSDGVKTVTLRVDNGTGLVSRTFSLEVVTEENDKLFSEDADLVSHEPDILNYVSEGRNSYKNIHRSVQSRIIDWLDEHRFTNTDGSKLTKANIFDIEEVRHWSKYMVLADIFEGLSNAIDDIFRNKADKYMDLAESARNRAQLRLDLDGDGDVDMRADLRTMDMRRA